MIMNDVIPSNTNETIWEIMERCSLSEEEEFRLKDYTESLGMIFLSTPFSRQAANRLEKMDVCAYKIGSGECNNLPLIKHIASFHKPIILSTGMNDLDRISKSVKILEGNNIDFALMHVTSMYPTPYENVRLNALKELNKKFPNTVLGLSDHSLGNYTCFASIPLGASILEKHFTSDKNWAGPDIPISINPYELKELIQGSIAIHKSLKGSKTILDGEKITAKFAYSCVVAIEDIKKGEKFSEKNIWVKRPGTGKIKAEYYYDIINESAKQDIKKDKQLEWDMIDN
jgi:N-acetylneuraminate synthase